MDTKAIEELNKKIKDITDVHRVVSNGLSWLSELDVKITYIAPVNEFVGFLQGFQKNLLEQKKVMEDQLPKPEVKAEEIVNK